MSHAPTTPSPGARLSTAASRVLPTLTALAVLAVLTACDSRGTSPPAPDDAGHTEEARPAGDARSGDDAAQTSPDLTPAPASPDPAPPPAADPPPPAGDEGPPAAETHELVGLTPAEVRQRRGRPSSKRAGAWVYTPDQPGCREYVVSEVVTFEGGKVSSVELSRDRTHRRCASR